MTSVLFQSSDQAAWLFVYVLGTTRLRWLQIRCPLFSTLLSVSGFPLGLAKGAPWEIRGALLPSCQPTSLEGHSSFWVAISHTCSSPGFQKPLPPF